MPFNGTSASSSYGQSRREYSDGSLILGVIGKFFSCEYSGNPI